MPPDFLTYDDVLLIHEDQTTRYGGSPDLRDPGLLSSAINQPQTSFEGQYLHTDLIEMAAAYLFHIIQNHPFMDGNKRTGTACALVFLDLNGIDMDIPEDELTDFILELARGNREKHEVSAFLRQYLP